MDIGSSAKSRAFAASMQSPGFLIRRLNQIHLALFAEETAGLEITPVQLSVLAAVARQGGRDQSAIAEETGVDRATMASVAARLEVAGLIRRSVCRSDQRHKLVHLTAKGKTTLAKMQHPAARANERTLAPLDASEREHFLLLLEVLVEGGNHHARTTLRPHIKGV